MNWADKVLPSGSLSPIQLSDPIRFTNILYSISDLFAGKH